MENNILYKMIDDENYTVLTNYNKNPYIIHRTSILLSEISRDKEFYELINEPFFKSDTFDEYIMIRDFLVE